jgi:probable F420-dependent oxidoreductase
VDIGIALPSVGPLGERDIVLDVARRAERNGFHSVWAQDHVAFPKTRTSVYPYPESTTELAFSPGMDWLDPVAVMGVVAGATERLVIGTSVLVVPYRNPVILAHELASLDRLSEGRIVLGVGSGWMDEEFAAVGVPKRERGARTDEAIELMRALWSADEHISFDGRFTQLEDVVLASHPHRTGGPPVMIGGNTEPALMRTGRLGDGWLGFEVFVDGVAAKRDAIQRAAEEVGRDPSAITLSVRRGLVPPFEVSNFLPERRSLAGEPEQVAEEIRAYEDEGVSLLVLDLPFVLPDVLETMDWIAEEVIPLLVPPAASPRAH